jgi:hypothetical protein
MCYFLTTGMAAIVVVVAADDASQKMSVFG